MRWIGGHSSSPEEEVKSWYAYLQENLQFPFTAINQIQSPPLQAHTHVEVLRMIPKEQCTHDMLVEAVWNDQRFAIPLGQLAASDADGGTQQAIADWHYWVKQGYKF